MKSVEFKVIKIRTVCQNVGYFHYRENLHVGCRLDIAALVHLDW